MRVPVSWLREYVDLGGASIEEIDAALVRVGLEVEAVHRLGEDVEGPIVVGEVREITELTEFKKPIRHCLVDAGEPELASIVCGATNFKVGDWVVVVRPGAVLPGGFKIGARKTYGHLSEGMICSLRELGLGDDHEGILVLPRAGLPEGTKPGSDAIALLELADTVFELAVTPDMGYCFSVRGIARELAHGLGTTFRDPGAVETPAADGRTAVPDRGRGSGRLRPVRRARRHRHRPVGAHSTVDAAAPAAGRRAVDLVDRRHHELPDAGARPADARVRPCPAHRPDRGPPRQGA